MQLSQQEYSFQLKLALKHSLQDRTALHQLEQYAEVSQDAMQELSLKYWALQRCVQGLEQWCVLPEML